MDLTPAQLDSIHEGFKQLTAPIDTSGSVKAGHSSRRRGED